MPVSGFDFGPMMERAKAAHSAKLAAAIKAVNDFGEHRILGVAQQLAPKGGAPTTPNDPDPGHLASKGPSTPAELVGTVITKEVGFNTPYAAVQDQNTEFRHNDNYEAFFFSGTIQREKGNFAPFIAKRMKAVTE